MGVAKALLLLLRALGLKGIALFSAALVLLAFAVLTSYVLLRSEQEKRNRERLR